MNLYVKELKSHWKSLFFWCVGVFLMVMLGMVEYGGYKTSDQSINDVMAEMPKALQAIMGLNSLDLSTVSGYYGLLFLYLLLMATIHAVMLGAVMIAKEERDKTSEFLFVKPVSRNQIITVKLMAAFTNIVILNLVTYVSSLVLVGSYSEGKSVTSDISITMAGMFFLQLIFLVFGSALAAVKKRSKSAASLSAGILLLTYVLSVAIDLNGNMENLRYFTPFKYFEAKNVMNGGGFELIFVFLSAAIIAAFTIVTYVFYKKRDLNA